jgi:glycolate oxidase iron-sulfur subunit
MVRDIAEVVAAEWQDGRLPDMPAPQPARRIAFQSSCSLQHGEKLNGVVESLLKRAGFKLMPVRYPFMCCGSAGAYSILQPTLAQSLRTRKMSTLLAGRPQAIATANVGCLTHLAQVSPVPVSHWIELLDTTLTPGDPLDAH